MFPAFLRRVPVLAVLVVVEVWARPEPETARVMKAREVVLREGPEESAELRVHPGFLTTLAFESGLVPGSVKVEAPERVRLLGAEGRVVVLEPLVELAEGERVRLGVTVTRGGASMHAVLVLVPHPSEVDGQVRVAVALPEKLAQVIAPTEPRAQSELLKLLLSGAVELGERLVGNQLWATLLPEGVDAKAPWLYRVGRQRVLAIPIHNPEESVPWEPRVVRLTSASLGPKPVALPIHMRAPPLMPGESGWVLMEWPLKDETMAFRLEVREREAGRGVRLEREGR
ncbi:DUF2381 family protein [Archangium minus]|uniref:DUF2381 family protein n=1 Tax=Archangium minus TaxID=83450 RepID=A0ABY9X6F1_9BACT|nr:DUF2381 family protein [Archangium minus]